MTDPTSGQKNPHLVESVYQALIHAVVPVGSVIQRRSSEGKRYTFTHRQTVTTTESAFYVYVENLTNNSTPLQVEPINLYTEGVFNVDLHHNADVDTNTFTVGSFNNTNTESTRTSDSNILYGTDDSVTVTDTGDTIQLTTIGSGNKTIGHSSSLKSLGVVNPGDNALIELDNVSNSDLDMSLTMWFYDAVPDIPDL